MSHSSDNAICATNVMEPCVCVNGIITKGDIAEARVVHRKGLTYLLAVEVLVGLLAILIAGDTFVHAWHDRSEMNLTVRLLNIAVCVVLFPWLISHRSWRPGDEAGTTVAYEITNDGLVDAGRGLLPWESFIRARRSDAVVVLYGRKPQRDLIVPRHLFADDDQWKRFNRVVQDRVLA